MSSLINHSRNEYLNKEPHFKSGNSRRRYILEVPNNLINFKTSINYEQQTQFDNSLLRIETKPSNHVRNEKTLSSYSTTTPLKYNYNHEPNLYLNDAIDDPWVKRLLQTDLDLSIPEQQDSSIQILNINDYEVNDSYSKNNSHMKRPDHNEFKRENLDSFYYPFIRKEKHAPSTNQNLSQLNRPNRKWILQPPTNAPINLNKDFFNNKKIRTQDRERSKSKTIIARRANIDEENILQQEKNSIIPKHKIYNNLHKKETTNHDNIENSNIENLFTFKEKRNIFIYILGIMLYKFGIEAFNGSIVSLATNRYDRDAFNTGNVPKTFEQVGLLVGLNQAFQCIGSILIAPLIKRWPARSVLSVSIFSFALFTALLMIIDAATGGKIKPSNFQAMHENDYSYYGRYPTSIIIPIYCLTGVVYGMVELIRRIIPRDIVGTDEEKLQRMDALVHVFYEIAGVSGALITGLVLIPRLGNNYSFIITPILFSLSAIVWIFIDGLKTTTIVNDEPFTVGNQNHKHNYLKGLAKGFTLFGQSVYLGGKIIFTNRKYFWLFPCYSLTLYIHRYIENGVAPQIAKRYLQNSEWSQIIVGGSNFGELIGALSVFFLTKKIRSPMVWLRLDSILLLLVWYLPFYNPSSISVKNAWIIALSFIPLGFGSAGDDISLNAHIQASLSKPQLKNKDISSLGAVMAFLYSSYIILYAILNPLLGKYIDTVYNSKQTIRPAFIFTVGVQVTIVSIIVTLSTFIPKGSCRLNPSLQ